MGVIGFGHAGVTVRDLERSLEFYRDALGLEIILIGEASSVAEQTWAIAGAKAKYALLRIPGTEVTLELHEFRGVEQHHASARPIDYAHGHFCLTVEDLGPLHADLVARGYGGRSDGPISIVDGPFAGAKVIYMKDPDGFHVELFQPPQAS